VIRSILDECEGTGVDLMFFVGDPREGDKSDGRLAIAPSSRPANERPAPPRRQAYQATQSVAAPRRDNTPKRNPPKDPLDNFLEDFEK
jgi:hypothetical protein